MCRFIAYHGTPLVIQDLIFEPSNSLINQSIQAKELDEPLNGDGFGIGWYSPEVSNEPAVFVSMTPAWSNRNLRNLAKKVRSPLIFAHVRAASMGESAEANCHPFNYGPWMFMHNGNIDNFGEIKRSLRNSLSDKIYSWLNGQTDSEHFFGLILDKILPEGPNVPPQKVLDAIKKSMIEVQEFKSKLGINSPLYLNTCLTNGRYTIATRLFAGDSSRPLTLYYSTGKKYICEEGVCRMIDGAKNHATIIASEPLTVANQDWVEVPYQHAILVQNNVVTTHAMNI